MIALSKSDITEVRELYEELQEKFAARGKKLYLVSAATRDGIRAVVEELAQVLRASKSA